VGPAGGGCTARENFCCPEFVSTGVSVGWALLPGDLRQRQLHCTVACWRSLVESLAAGLRSSNDRDGDLHPPALCALVASSPAFGRTTRSHCHYQGQGHLKHLKHLAVLAMSTCTLIRSYTHTLIHAYAHTLVLRHPYTHTSHAHTPIHTHAISHTPIHAYAQGPRGAEAKRRKKTGVPTYLPFFEIF
jgi:hypothetical protein